MASVTSLPPLFPSPPLYSPPTSHPFPFAWRGVCDFGQPVPQCSPAFSPSCCCGVCAPTCARHAALVSSRRLAPCPLLTDSRHLQNSFSPWNINFSLFSSLSMSFSLSSLPQPCCSPKVSAFSPFLCLLWLYFCPLWSVCVCDVVDNPSSWCSCPAGTS